MKNGVLLLVFALTVFPVLADVTVSDISVRQRWPWNGLVDVDFVVSGAEAMSGYHALPTLSSDGKGYVAQTFVGESVIVGDGAHRVTWNCGADFPETVLSNMTATVTLAPLGETEPLYLVIDLSGGKDAASYPHRYTTQEPDLSDDTCRTTELWLKRVPAGSFMRGNPACVGGQNVSTGYLPYHQVNLTKAYYLGIFELTQQQYYLMEGAWPSYFSYEPDRATRPLEQISLTGFRGTNNQYGWYDDSELSAGPLSRLRTKTGFATLDLPSEAQWERAARAGVEGAEYPWADIDASRERNKQTPGTTTSVSQDTPSASGGTEKVGMHEPNPWGFYDMGGNVCELSTSGYAYNGSNPMVVADYAGAPYTDPLGPTPEWSTRNGGADYTGAVGATIMGGGWTDWMSSMNVYRRQAIARSTKGNSSTIGIRLCITCK